MQLDVDLSTKPANSEHMENTFHKNAKPLLGKRFGKLLVQQVMPKRSNGKVVYLCLCDCGKHHEVVSTVLRKGKSTHCGCSWPSVNKKHGMSKSREHKSWTSAIDRCRKSHRQHANYYDRGIYVCKEWKGKNGFSKFYEHIGSCPSPLHSLDRIDNNKGYDVGNVRWATRSQQSINRRPRMSVESFSDDVLLSEIKRRNLKLN